MPDHDGNEGQDHSEHSDILDRPGVPRKPRLDTKVEKVEVPSDNTHGSWFGLSILLDELGSVGRLGNHLGHDSLEKADRGIRGG